MSTPQFPDQVKRAPAEFLRSVFAGIGRILLAADRQDPMPQQAEAGAGTARTVPGQGAGAPGGEPGKPGGSYRWRSLDQTGNVRVLTADEIDADELRGGTGPAGAAAASTADAAPEAPPVLPLAGYDGLSLPSIRARLRLLSQDQVQVLADYERKNAARHDVLGMLERRIDKLARGG